MRIEMPSEMEITIKCWTQARFYVRAGAIALKPEFCRQMFSLQQQYMQY